MVAIDHYARKIAIEKFGLPRCLHVPIAARPVDAIQRFVGSTSPVTRTTTPVRALRVKLQEVPPINHRLPIWSLEQASIFHTPDQVWGHVDYSGYRGAYSRAFPGEDLEGRVLDHVLNRRVARLKGFAYLGIVPIRRAANSSSGGLSEKWAVSHHSSARMRAWNRSNPAQIQYADLADLVKMLDMKTGGALQDPVNEAQSLLRED